MRKFWLSTSVAVLFGIYLAVGRSGSASQPAALPVIEGGSLSAASSSAPAGADAGGSAPPVQPSQPAVVAQAAPAPSQPAQAPAPKPAAPATQPAPAKPAGQYKDGTYTGQSADAYYGMVQAQAVISGGKLADIKMLSYPSDRSTSREISSFALPQLISEAITAQSANVDMVSGATDTSQAFRQSLGSALAMAKN